MPRKVREQIALEGVSPSRLVPGAILKGPSSRASAAGVRGLPLRHSDQGRFSIAPSASAISAERSRSISGRAAKMSRMSPRTIVRFDWSCLAVSAVSATLRASLGQSPPARSAIESRGRQLSAARFTSAFTRISDKRWTRRAAHCI